MDVKLTQLSGSVPSMQHEMQPGYKATKALESKPKEAIAPIQEKTDSKLEKAIDKMNEYVQAHHTELHYKMYDKLHTYYVQIVNTDTNEVIKEIPQKKFLDMYAMIAEKLGFITDHKI